MKINKSKNKKLEKILFAEEYYAVVKFVEPGDDTKSFACIPDNWFLRDDEDEVRRRCYWPPKSNKSFTLRAMNRDEPDEDWNVYTCEVVSEGHATYSIGASIVREKTAQKYNTSSADEHIQKSKFRRQHPGLINNGEKCFENVFAAAKAAHALEKSNLKVGEQQSQEAAKESGISQHKREQSQKNFNSVNKNLESQPFSNRSRSRSNQSSTRIIRSESRSTRSNSHSNHSRSSRIRSRSRSKTRSSRSGSKSHIIRSKSPSNHSRSSRICSGSRSKSHTSRSKSPTNHSRSSIICSRSRSKTRIIRSESRSTRSNSHSNHSRSSRIRSRSRSKTRSSRSRNKSHSSRSKSPSNHSRSSKIRSGSRNKSHSSSSNSCISRSESNSSGSKSRNNRSLPSRNEYVSRKTILGCSSNTKHRDDRTRRSSSVRGKHKTRRSSILGTHKIDRKEKPRRRENGFHSHKQTLTEKVLMKRPSKDSRESLPPQTRNRIRVEEMYRQHHLQRAFKPPLPQRDHQRRHSPEHSSSSSLQSNDNTNLLKNLLKEVKEVKAMINKNERRFVESDRRLTRLEVTVNKSFIVLGDLSNAFNARMTLGSALPRETKPPKGFHSPKLPIKRLRHLVAFNKDFQNDECFNFLVNREREYCTSSTSTDTVTMTAYLKRFISVDLRATLVLKDLKGEQGLTLYHDFHRVYEFLREVMKAGYLIKGKILTNNDVHIVLRTVWGRSKQALAGEVSKKK